MTYFVCKWRMCTSDVILRVQVMCLPSWEVQEALNITRSALRKWEARPVSCWLCWKITINVKWFWFTLGDKQTNFMWRGGVLVVHAEICRSIWRLSLLLYFDFRQCPGGGSPWASTGRASKCRRAAFHEELTIPAPRVEYFECLLKITCVQCPRDPRLQCNSRRTSWLHGKEQSANSDGRVLDRIVPQCQSMIKMHVTVMLLSIFCCLFCLDFTWAKSLATVDLLCIEKADTFC